MSATNSQFDIVFREISEYFTDIPHITVTPGEGSPPEQYTVTYRIPGICKEESGAVSFCDNHVVSITIPPNFPHLPPICFPESPTFHPDFLPSAIRISAAWEIEAEHSIVKLILYIAKMISGEVYSTSGAINEEAVEWYERNREHLPFTENWTGQGEAFPSGTPGDEDESYRIEMIDDEEFAQSFSLEESPPGNDGVDPEFLNIMARQKRFHAISQILQKTDEQFDGRGELEEKTRSSLNEAMELFQEASDLEHQGMLQKALEKFQAIEELVSDYPLLHKAKKRVQQAFDLLGAWVNENEGNESTAEAGAASSALHPRQQAFDEYTAEKRRKRVFLLLGGSIIILAVLVISSSLFFNSQLNKAEKNYRECRTLLNNNSFEDAEQKCNLALELSENVYIVKQERKTELAAAIRSLLDSPDMRQGVAGKVLLDGKYVTLAQKELILEFRKTREKGDSLFSQKRWQQAFLHYSEALGLANKAGLSESDELANLHENIVRTEIYLAIEKGKDAFSSAQWNKAVSHYKKAIELVEENASLLGNHYVEQTSQKLDSILLHAAIIHKRQNVNKLLQRKQYEPALQQLEEILKDISSSDYADQPQFQKIHKEIASLINETEEDLRIYELETYLTENYKELFHKHYPSTRRSELSTPRVTFLKEIKDKLLFRMQCTETFNTRSLRLEMHYLYWPSRGTWQFYGEQ